MDGSILSPLERRVLDDLQTLATQQGLPVAAAVQKLLKHRAADQKAMKSGQAQAVVAPEPDDRPLAHLSFEQLLERIAARRDRMAASKSGTMTMAVALDLVRDDMCGIDRLPE